METTRTPNPVDVYANACVAIGSMQTAKAMANSAMAKMAKAVDDFYKQTGHIMVDHPDVDDFIGHMHELAKEEKAYRQRLSLIYNAAHKLLVPADEKAKESHEALATINRLLDNAKKES